MPEKDKVSHTSGKVKIDDASSARDADGTTTADATKDSKESFVGDGKSKQDKDVASEADKQSNGSAEDESSSLSDSEKVTQAQAEMEEWRNKYLRLHAEWDTYRRRTSEQRADEKACATQDLVESLLPVIDDFERSIDYAEKNGEKGLLSGVEAVHTKLIDALKKEGVEVINPQGEAFDALKCQAIGAAEDTSVPDETVSEVYQKGYKMGKKVLRPAMVTVATGGPKREVPQEAEEE